ncbi:MAG: phosphonopyruvate decarboxylase [Lentisphaeria bacterium]|nr:phosphonopyruvate decarboxylase [Lentisphaeria bacterium]
MISCNDFISGLRGHGIDFFTGVPDSLLKPFCSFLRRSADSRNHLTAPNEGSAVAVAAGHYLATGKSALVYMQNSGIGNAVNPLLSLADPAVYSIPMLLLVGWRGEPGTADEPQHIKQGAVTTALFDTMGIPYLILEPDGAAGQVAEAVRRMRELSGPVALIVRKGVFADEPAAPESGDNARMTREEALGILSGLDAFFVSTTGFASRELFELREQAGQGHKRDFLTVGSMGHASMIALGIALARPGLRVCCLDGDGAFLMHMGSAVCIAARKPENLIHVVINNGVHDSVGGQPTDAANADLAAIARQCGYGACFRVQSAGELRRLCVGLPRACCFIEVGCRPGARKDLGRPAVTPLQNRNALMRSMEEYDA